MATIVQAVTAVTALGALVFTGLSLNSTQEQVAAAREQNQVVQQGQYTDRYTKAVDQLGQQDPQRLQVRLGGIYALERLARDSPRDQPTVIEVLSAFIRTTTPQPSPSDCPNTPPTADIQAALTVLGRRDPTHDNNTHIDLTHTCLRQANLFDANLFDANLRDVDLRGANLFDANLRDAYLFDAYLFDAYLFDAYLFDADLSDADLSDADLSFADLDGADLDGADLDGAILVGAILVGAILVGAILVGANLSGAILVGANLSGALHDATTDVSGVITDAETIGRWW